MSNDELHNRFLKAFEVANQMDIDIPIDLRLQYYAYYKQATDNCKGYVPLAVIKKNNHKPLAVVDLETFILLNRKDDDNNRS